MKTKPGKYGIKIWVCADVKTSYLLRLQVYTGMVDNTREINQGQRVVLDLMKPFLNKGYGVTTYKFFTSFPLASELLKQCTTLVGTLRSNKKEIPKEFLPDKRKDVHSSIFGFTQDTTLVSYVPKKSKAVILLSTQHHGKTVSSEENNSKPEIILHYNKTKGAVDIGDKMTREYSCVRSTRRWPFRIFMEMLDIAALNAYILYTQRFPKWKNNNSSRREGF